MLARLLLAGGQPVSADALADLLWPEDPDATSGSRVHVMAHRIRALLDEKTRLRHDTLGYRLTVGPGELDVTRFDELAAGLLGGRFAGSERERVADEALGLWRGEPFEGLDAFALDPEVLRWRDQRRAVQTDRFQSAVDAGRIEGIGAALAEEARRHPLDERLQGLLMRALHLSGRQADALEVYARARRVMVEELGLEPGHELQELHAAVLSGEAPAWGLSRRTPSQLPAAPAALIGREAELDTLDRLVGGDAGAPVVVSGDAGSGKTALVLQWAHRHRAEFPDGQLFADLRGFSAEEPARALDVLGAFIRGLTDETPPPGLDERAALFRTLVHGRRLLLVLDNARSAAQVRHLLPGDDGCTVLLTSRESLSGLAVRHGARTLQLQALAEADAIALLERAVGAGSLDARAARRIAARCARLPLALLIAGNRVTASSSGATAQLATELEDEHARLDALDAGDGPETDIRAVLSWSYEAAGEGPARVFRRLGLLPGEDADLPAIAALCGEEPRAVARDLAALARAHLVDDLGGRFRQHDLLRAYAQECAAGDPARQAAAARRRLLQFYAYRSAVADVTCRPVAIRYARADRIGPPATELEDTATARAWFEREWPNVRAAIEAVPEADEALIVELALAWHQPLQVRGDLETMCELDARARDIAARLGDTGAEAHACNRIALGCATLGRLREARRHLVRARRLDEASGDASAASMTLSNDSLVAALAGDWDEAIASAEAAMRMDRRLGSDANLSVPLTNLGHMYVATGRFDDAARVLDEAIAICRENAELSTLAVALANRAWWGAHVGRLDESLRDSGEALDLAHEIADPMLESMALIDQAETHFRRGDLARARDVLARAVHPTDLAGDVSGRARLLDLTARIAAATDPRGAVAYFEECLAHAERFELGGFAARARDGIAQARATVEG